jgi:Mg-chelatase subunit ChlD
LAAFRRIVLISTSFGERKPNSATNDMTNKSMNCSLEETQSMDDEWSMMNEEVSALQTAFRCLHSSIGANIAAPVSTHVCWTVTARRLPEEQRAAVDIMVALDVSASMTGRKLQLCKRTLQQLLRLLSDDDRFGLITYATRSTLDFPLRKMTTESKAAALLMVHSLVARDGTNISSAIGLAFQELRAIDSSNTIRTVFLLTDGQANGGITGVAELAEFTKNSVKGPELSNPNAPIVDAIMIQGTQRLPLSMFCFGYGSGHDEHLLASISAAASGSYYNIDDDSAVDGAFGDALGGIMSMVAQNATATFRLAPEAQAQGARIVKIHHHEVVERESGGFSVNVGDFYAEESRDIVIELHLSPTPARAGVVPHVVASVAYSDVAQKIPVQGPEQIASIERTEGTEVSEQDEYVATQLLRVAATEALERARAKANLGDLGAARLEITRARNGILASPVPVRFGTLISQLQSDLTDISSGLASASVYDRIGSKRLTQTSLTHRDQRCSESTFKAQAANAYATSSKVAFLGKMKSQPKDP